jgi:predicted Zn-dependent peptidase
MDLMSDIVINPVFSESELEKYKKRRQPQLEEQRSQPGFLSREKFYRAVYRDFPAAIVTPTTQSLAAVHADDLRKYHDMYFVPNSAILSIVGDLKLDQAKALAERFFGFWRNHAVPLTKLPPIAPLSAKKIYLIDRPGSVQTNILAGNLALKRVDPDYIPLRVLNRVLGSSFASRLFLNLREEKGYTYGAYSGITANIYPGVFAARTEVRNAVTDGSTHEILRELTRIRDEVVPDEELEESRRAIVADFALSLEKPQELLDDWLTVEYYGLPVDYWDRYPERESASHLRRSRR